MPRKLKILFLGEPNSQNTVSWVEGMRELGCDVEIASVRTTGRDGTLPVGIWLLPPRLRVLTGAGNLMEIIDRKKPDLIIAYRVTSYGFLAALTDFSPLVIAAQNEQITYAPEQGFLRKMLMGFFARYAIRRAQMIHAWGANIKAGLMKFGAPEEKILVLHRGIDTGIFKPGENPRTCDPKAPVFISTRSMEKEYLIDRLIDSFSILVKDIPSAKLVIVGDGSMREMLEAQTVAAGISGNVVFKGRIPPADLADELRNSDFYISLIDTEGISSSLIEACACGIVPIVADIPASRELVEDGVNGILLRDSTPSAVAEAMKGAISMTGLARKSLEYSKTVVSRYDRRTNLKKFVEHYRLLAGIDPSDEDKVHICHVTTSHRENDIRIFQREACSLVKKGYKVSLVVRGRRKSYPRKAEGVDIYPIRYIFGRPGRKLILPRIAVRKALKLKPDIYHFHDPELLPWMCYIAKNYGAKVVWDVHELYSETIQEFHIRRFGLLARIISSYYTRFEKMFCKSFSGIVAVTDPIRERYEKMGLSNCVTVRNTIDLKRLPGVKAPPKSPVFSVLASGTTNSSRCVMELVEAFQIVVGKHPSAQLNLVSSFDSEDEKNKIQRSIDEKGLGPNIMISKLIPWEELLSSVIPRNHVGLVLYAKSPNNCVGLPNRLFEYWACKVPVIGTDTPLLKKVVEDAGGGRIVNSENPAEIADAISYYIENPNEALRQGLNGYNAVVSEYNWEKDLETLCALYETILREN